MTCGCCACAGCAGCCAAATACSCASIAAMSVVSIAAMHASRIASTHNNYSSNDNEDGNDETPVERKKEQEEEAKEEQEKEQEEKERERKQAEYKNEMEGKKEVFNAKNTMYRGYRIVMSLSYADDVADDYSEEGYNVQYNASKEGESKKFACDTLKGIEQEIDKFESEGSIHKEIDRII